MRTSWDDENQTETLDLGKCSIRHSCCASSRRRDFRSGTSLPELKQGRLTNNAPVKVRAEPRSLPPRAATFKNDRAAITARAARSAHAFRRPQMPGLGVV